MSDPDVPQSEQPKDVDDVVGSANAGLDAAAAAGADIPGASAQPAADASVDPDLAAFEAAERDHPGTFQPPAAPAAPPRVTTDADETAVVSTPAVDREETTPFSYRDEEPTVADTAYSHSYADDETRVLPSEPLVAAAATPLVPQPIFVQAPEPPRDRGNRGTAGAIGLLATLVFALLYLGTTIGLGALAGDVTGENIGTAAVAPLTTWGFWTPVVVFFLGFWFLGAIINRGRWGLWVVFGIIVGAIAYGGHILGQVFEARFWTISPSAGLELVGEQLLAPLAIAAFVFARELTIWFGAWVARSGARKTELNAEAQREYERTLEAGPTLAR
ncbi:hypothetical protein SRABI76_00822 [Microbacterium oxydans]|uniref:Uncharacterized protein n=1 Tax=Microbacterium oxydans TaxID=82380 RepID=A0A0F0L9C7_9MICO|nr:hypothetical protein [Microbacterium oxydans]KJL29792.1 hypothetical protein RS83_01362 [Microbacterium oxydans]CAH0152290.1 hypothetical protein SRABI76_00822 [Microbacterium oxydans]